MEPEIINENDELEPEKTGLWKSAMTYGLYYAIISIVITVVFYATGNMTSKVNQWLGIVIMIVAVVLIQLAYRKQLGGWMTYGQGLGIAVLSMVCASIITAIFTFVLYKYIDPGLLEQIRLATEEQMYQRGLPDDQISAAMAVTSKFQTPGVIALSAIFSMALIGLIIGAIAAIFTKKQSPDTIFN
jgi:chromate transport protein ChrA